MTGIPFSAAASNCTLHASSSILAIPNASGYRASSSSRILTCSSISSPSGALKVALILSSPLYPRVLFRSFTACSTPFFYFFPIRRALILSDDRYISTRLQIKPLYIAVSCRCHKIQISLIRRLLSLISCKSRSLLLFAAGTGCRATHKIAGITALNFLVISKPPV